MDKLTLEKFTFLFGFLIRTNVRHLSIFTGPISHANLIDHMLPPPAINSRSCNFTTLFLLYFLAKTSQLTNLAETSLTVCTVTNPQSSTFSFVAGVWSPGGRSVGGRAVSGTLTLS